MTKSFIDRCRDEQRPGVPAVDVRDTLGQGLMLRVSPRTISWGWKAERFGRTQRLDLGPVDGLTIAQARAIANAATDLLRSGDGLPTDRWLVLRKVEMGLITREEAYPDVTFIKVPPPPKPRGWTYEQAVGAYLDAHEGEWKASTLPDARKNLRHPILLGLLKHPVSTVTPDLLATLITAKNKTHHKQAVAIYVRLNHFFAWLASPGPRLLSGVAKGHLDDLQRPKKPKPKEAKDGTLIEPVRRQRVRFPTMERVGLLVALARTDLLRAPFPAVLLLLVATVQRRYAIATAKIAEFAPIPTEPGWGVWRLPPVRRKTGEQDSAQAHHSVPLPSGVGGRPRADRGVNGRRMAVPGDASAPEGGDHRAPVGQQRDTPDGLHACGRQPARPAPSAPVPRRPDTPPTRRCPRPDHRPRRGCRAGVSLGASLR